MEFVELWEQGLSNIVAIAKLILESISVFCVVVGLGKTAQLVGQLIQQRRRGKNFPFNQVRLKFGLWLALALEFQLGADVLTTTVAPTLEELGRLVIVAAVRTFLNYFLGKELEAEMEQEHRKQEHEAQMAQRYDNV